MRRPRAELKRILNHSDCCESGAAHSGAVREKPFDLLRQFPESAAPEGRHPPRCFADRGRFELPRFPDVRAESHGPAPTERPGLVKVMAAQARPAGRRELLTIVLMTA